MRGQKILLTESVAESPRKRPPTYAIASVDHALQLASALQLEGRLTVKDAAERLSVATSTAHRLLQMLVFRDFATQGDDRVYYAGPVLKLDGPSQAWTNQLRAICEKHLRHLTKVTKESSSLVIRTGDRARVLLAIEPSGVTTAGARDGMSFTAWRATAGRLSLAELDPSEVDGLFPEGHPDPPDRAALRRNLAAIAQQGFAMNDERADRGVVAVGVPLRNAAGEFLAGIATAMPSVRYQPEMLPGLVATLKQTAQDIQSELLQDH